MRSKWDINWQVEAPRGNDQLYPWNCDKDTLPCFLNNCGDDDGIDDDDDDENDDVEVKVMDWW